MEDEAGNVQPTGQAMSAPLTATLLVDCRNARGEGVHWHPGRRRVFWTDIKGAALWSCDEDGRNVRKRELPANLCDFAFADDGRMIAAFEDGIGWLDPVTGERTIFEPYMPDNPDTRMNDCGLDRQGRFIAGGMDEANRAPIAPVWSVDRGSVRPVIEGVRIANAICFSPDGTQMYFADTPTGQIRRYAYDTFRGQPGDAAVFASFGEGEGKPDGATVDSEGAVWNAVFGGGCVQRFLPDGTRELRVDLPVPNVTNCAIGGRDWRRMFITTARIEMDDDALAAHPDAGGLFVVDLPVPGLPEGTYRR